MVTIEPIRVEVEREDDGRVLASVPDLPGVMAYGANEDEAFAPAVLEAKGLQVAVFGADQVFEMTLARYSAGPVRLLTITVPSPSAGVTL